jgi:Zn-dependent protease with chaperone function
MRPLDVGAQVGDHAAMSEPSSTPRRTFEHVAPQSWEHPADRAALQTLRAVPGFDQVVKKTIGFFGEAGIRTTFQANAVRVGPRQYEELHRLKLEAQTTLDWQDEVPLFVSQTPWFNAGAYGVDHPFIVLNSATVDILDADELRVVLGHEIGHVMSGHALYRTMLALILSVGLHNLPFLTGIALLPIRFALQEWSRKSELSSDRAALLVCGNVDHALSMFLKAAGGTVSRRHVLSLDAYKEQVLDYQKRGGVDTFFKIINLLDQTHPYHTLRAAELLDWSASDGYRAILDGNYRRRGDEPVANQYGADVSEAASYYAGEAREKVSEVSDAARVIAQQASAQAKHAATEFKAAIQSVAEGAASRIAAALKQRDR